MMSTKKMVPTSQHIQFFDEQLRAIEREWKKYMHSPINRLLAEGKIHLGRIWGVERKSDAVILRFKASAVIPRMKKPYYLTILTESMPPSPKEWGMSYGEYRSSSEPILCQNHGTEITPKFSMGKGDGKWIFVGVSGFDSKLLQKLRTNVLSKGEHPVCLIAETDPPVKYLVQLREFVKEHPDHGFFSTKRFDSVDSWRPVNLDNAQNILQEVHSILSLNQFTSIQGPPGTGKSYLAAQLCESFLQQGKTVILTALTNQALMEVGEKPALQANLKSRNIYKTNLSSDEEKKLAGLQRFSEGGLPKGSLLLASYYALSQYCKGLILNRPVVEWLIIEEASQAYLAALAMFSGLAEKVVIIGDHQQLPPIVLDRERVDRLHPEIHTIIEGLKTINITGKAASLRLTKTRRLTTDSARLTGLFYDNQLSSIAEPPAVYCGKYATLLADGGGVSKVVLPYSTEISTIAPMVAMIAKDILLKEPKAEIALLTSLIRIEQKLAKEASTRIKHSPGLTISTVHRVQGLTVDYSLIVLGLENASFDLDPSLFNVATSRAKRGTIIFTKQEYQLITNVDPIVRTFIDKAENKTAVFEELFS